MFFKKTFILITVFAIMLACSKKEQKIIPKKEEIIKKTEELKKAKEKISEKINKAKDKIFEKKDDIIKSTEDKKETTARLWKIYQETRRKIKEAKMNEKFDELLNLLKRQSKISEKLKKYDIQAWQLNNIGYYSIEEFKKRVKYNQTMAKIYSTTDKKKRKEMYDNLKQRMKENFEILKNSYGYLLEAKKISEKEGNKKQQKIIANNISYINDIKKMIEKADTR